MPEALGLALSWAGVPDASVGGVWPSMNGRAWAWRLAKQMVVRLLLAAESAPSWGDLEQLQSWSALAGSVTLPGKTSVQL